MNLITEEQINQAGLDLLKLITGKSYSYDSVHSPEKATASSLAFISTLDMLEHALKNEVKGLIILEKKFSELKPLIPESKTVWTTPHIQFAMSRILSLFDTKKKFQPSGIHPTAIIHPEAQVDKSVHIGAYSVIEQFAKISPNSIIGAHCVVQAHAKIGSNTTLSPHVVIGFYCQIGSNCLIAPHVTIGSDGFGFFTDKQGKHHKIPQIGIVVIEDDCELGSHCAIDRAALEETRIKKGSKLDNFCHIAHNVELGENGLTAAALKVAGSTKIGSNFMTGGNVDVNGHIHICNNVILFGRTGVTSSIDQPGIYGGFPLESHRDSLKTIMSLPHVSKLRKQVNKILIHLNIKET
ncbi:MAG: UDP-3-O-(3-hydroxymyristoyl)glucosamine N-acyltransferase [Pseudobdellovibrio sp.]